MRVNQTPQAVGEQHIDLTRFNDCRYFAFAELWMHHGLAPAIGARAIIGRPCFRRRYALGAAFIWNPRVTNWTTHPRNLAALANCGDHVSAIFVAGYAPLFHSISDFQD